MSSTSSREESNTEDLEDLVQSHEVEDSQELAPEVAEEQGNQDEEAEEAPTRTAEKPKRVVRNPQPKLNAETLKGPKGIHTLPQLFKNTKFKGLGYEEEDLNMLMKSYEYWCHRLFPKFSFDDCLARLEKLGHKKAVQVNCIVQIDLKIDYIQDSLKFRLTSKKFGWIFSWRKHQKYLAIMKIKIWPISLKKQ